MVIAVVAVADGRVTLTVLAENDLRRRSSVTVSEEYAALFGTR